MVPIWYSQRANGPTVICGHALCKFKHSKTSLTVRTAVVYYWHYHGLLLWIFCCRSVPPYFKWLSYLSWFKYGNEALLINQWSDVNYIDCTRSNTTCPRNGQVVLETFNFEESHFSLDIWSLIMLIAAFRVLAYIALVYRTFRKE